MINNKSIGALVIVILGMALIVYLHERQSRPVRDAQIGKPVLPELKANLDDVREVKLSSADKTTTIEHKDNKWTVAEKGGYAADFGKLSSFLDGLAKAKYVERKTSKPENFAVLGLSGVDDTSSKAVKVSVSTSDGSDYELLIGNKSAGEQGRFVRKPTESQTWLADSIGDVSSDPLKWIEPVILSINSGEVSSVTDTSADGKQVLSVSREKEGGNFVIKDLPKGAELKYPTIADSLSRALENLRAADVQTRDSQPWKDAARADYHLKDGSNLVVLARQDGNGRHWLRLDLAKSKKPSEDVSFVDTSRLDGFEFQVPDYTFSEFTKTMSDMIAEEEPKKTAVPAKKKASPKTT